MYFHSLVYVYHICDCASDVKSAHTHIYDSFGVVMYFGLGGESRSNWEGME